LPVLVRGLLRARGRVLGLLQGLSLLLPGPGRALRALPEPVPVLPSLRLPQVSAPQPSYNQRRQRIMPQKKLPK
jgi:hypothetical protein